MAEKTLEYQSMRVGRRVYLWAWLGLLVMGILYGVVCLVLVGEMILLFLLSRNGVVVIERLGPWPLVSVVEVLFAGGVGVAYVWTSVRVKQGSLRAARVGEVVAIVNEVLFGGMIFVMMVIQRNTWNRAERRGNIMVMIVLGMALAANFGLAWVLGKYAVLGKRET